FDLAKEQAPLAVGPRPVFQQRPSDRRNAGIAAIAPERYAAADEIDVIVFLRPVLSPERIEGELLGFLLRGGNGNEVTAWPASVGNRVGNAVFVEKEIPLRHLEGRIDDRVFDNDLLHGASSHPGSRRGDYGGRGRERQGKMRVTGLWAFFVASNAAQWPNFA